MSQSLLPKGLPDFLRQQNLDKTLELLRQPGSLALLASLGLHGSLWLGFPLLPGDQPSPLETQRTVQVVELSPLEQQRLPGVSAPQPALPSASNSLGSLFQPLPQPAPIPSPIDPSLYNIPIPSLPSLPPPPYIPPPIFPELNSPLFNPGLIPPPPKPSPQARRSPLPEPQPSTTPRATPQPDSSPIAKPPVRPETIPPAAIAALRAEQEKIRQQREKYTPNTANTSNEEVASNSQAFQAYATELSQGELGKFDQYVVTAALPQDACSIIQQERMTAIGVVVNPEGEAAGEPKLIASSGYKTLDEIAFSAISKETFEKSDKYQWLVFKYLFNPQSTCPKQEQPPA